MPGQAGIQHGLWDQSPLVSVVSPAAGSLSGSPCKHVVRRWAQKQAHQNEAPKECDLCAPSWCALPAAGPEAGFISWFASWFHLYLRKDKDLCSGNASPCSQTLLLSSWWTGMEGMHLLGGIQWCPGTNGSDILICLFSTLGKRKKKKKKKPRWRGMLAGRGVQNKLSQLQPAVTCQWILTRASGLVGVQARDVPNRGGRVTSGQRSQPSLQVRNKLPGPSLPWV